MKGHWTAWVEMVFYWLMFVGGALTFVAAVHQHQTGWPLWRDCGVAWCWLFIAWSATKKMAGAPAKHFGRGE